MINEKMKFRGIKMLKKDLLLFIERVENKAVNSVRKKFNEEIEKKRKEVFEKYEDKINQYQDTINRVSTQITDLITDMKEDKEVDFSGNYYLTQSMERMGKLKIIIYNNCNFNGEVKKIEILKQKEIDEVKENYSKVYAVCKSMSSAKQIAIYLEGLGFDLSDLKEKENKSLVAEIDKSKLFVCGDNK